MIRKFSGVLVGAFLLGVVAFAPAAFGEISIDSFGVAVVEDFQSFTGSGFDPTAGSGTLDSDSYRVTGLSDMTGAGFGDSLTTGDFARGISVGGESTGGVYAFDVGGGDIGVGVQPTAEDFTPGEFTIRFQNNTGASIPAMTIDANGWFFNDGDRSSTWSVWAALTDSPASYVPIPGALYTSAVAADAMPEWELQDIGGTFVLPVPIASGGEFFIQFRGDDAVLDPGSGDRDEFALSSLSVTAVPEPEIFGGLVLLCCVGPRRRRQHDAWHSQGG